MDSSRRRPPATVLALAVATCALLAPSGSLATDSTTPLRGALRFLLEHQSQTPPEGWLPEGRSRDYPGNWPQFVVLSGSSVPRLREVSPFMVAAIHHALSLVSETNGDVLGLRRGEIEAARQMRRRAVHFMSRFESPAGKPDAGTFGFWPHDDDSRVPPPRLENAVLRWLQGPVLGGDRVPLNASLFFPRALAIPSDADTTAMVYVAFLNDGQLDGGDAVLVPFHEFFDDWRDLGDVPRRLNPPWMARTTGAYLTWLTYREPAAGLFPNDVDLVVNANVLFALGRYGRLDTPGVDAAIRLIQRAVSGGLHRDRHHEITAYYPDNLAFEYAVSRAFHAGGVAALASVVEVLADELESAAVWRADGTVSWDRGAPRLNTAFAMLTLLNAGRDSDLVDRAAEYLAAEQRSDGGYAAAPFFIGRPDGGQVFEYQSASLTTAVVLEALARHALSRASRPN